jgi:hypothetical protein
VSARYQVTVDLDTVAALDTSVLPAGLRIVEISEPDWRTFGHLVTFDDDEAPDGTEGSQVSLMLRITPARKVAIASRHIQPKPA